VSWAVHDLEPYVFQRKLGKGIAISFVAVLIGSWGPDLLTKWFVYGVGAVGIELKADDPATFHRGWPGVGFTHSLTFGVVVALLVYLVSKSKAWALGLMLGIWFHTISDVGDTMGVMLFFPWTHHFALGIWAYAGQTGRVTDAAAYYSGLGWVWDALWIVLALLCWPVFRRSYFHERVVPADGFWAWSGRVLPDDALLVIYRGALFFGICRFTTWMLWAHVYHHYPFDLSWGGPHWVDAAYP